ncbi:MAG TPA: shikimate kinase [Terriglobales bacterium]|jgi:shikimate kinase|nr:shikimate kinase [Terriglobales bacterium]
MTTHSGPQAGPKTPARQSASTVRAIFLVGFMGAGKTSVGKALGRRLAWPFEDLDDRIQDREKRSVEQIFRESGEKAFRQVETDALREVLDALGSDPRVIALGGGAFVQPENAFLLQREDVATIFLDGPVEELFRRCNKQQVDRPLRGTLDQFQKLYESRRPLYSKASIQLDTSGKDVEAVAEEVSRILAIPQKD